MGDDVEPMLNEAFVARLAVEALDVAVLLRLAPFAFPSDHILLLSYLLLEDSQSNSYLTLRTCKNELYFLLFPQSSPISFPKISFSSDRSKGIEKI